MLSHLGSQLRKGRYLRSLPEAVVGRIAGERRLGRSLAAIATALNDDDIPTAQGGTEWRPSSVAAVLKSIQREEGR